MPSCPHAAGHYKGGFGFNPLIAAALGVLYLVGRELYAASYAKEPGKRGPGFGLSFLPTVVLIIGGLVGAIRACIVLKIF